VVFADAIHGDIKVSNAELDDLIILRSDGSPTYNFTVAVDDSDMSITHVIRGNDHINNTPRQIHILQALGATLPLYAHVPMILGEDGKRLSKRHGAVSVMSFESLGILPQALLNYLVRLGWSHGDQEIFSLQDIATLFDLEHVQKSPAIFDQDKLLWINQHYIKNLPASELIAPLEKQFEQLGVNRAEGPSLAQVIEVQRERVKTLQEMAQCSHYFFETPTYDDALKASLIDSDMLSAVHAALSELSDWTADAIRDAIKNVAKELDLKLGKVAPVIRFAVTGGKNSPAIGLTLMLIGKAQVLERINLFR